MKIDVTSLLATRYIIPDITICRGTLDQRHKALASVISSDISLVIMNIEINDYKKGIIKLISTISQL